MSLRARLTAFVAVSVGLAVAVVAFFAYGFARDEAVDEVDQFLRERGPVVGILGALEFEDIRAGPGQGAGQGAGRGSGVPRGDGLGDLNSIVREDAVAQFVDGSGNIVAFGESGVILPVSDEDEEIAKNGKEETIRDVYVDGIHYRMLTRHIGPNTAIQVARDMSGTDEILAGLRLRLILLGLAGVGAAAGLGWVVSRRSLRPVGVLTEAAAHVAETRDLDARIDIDGSDEVGQLARSFNSMLAALEDARASQQRLVADASHELRTPLTSLRTNIELLERGAVAGADRDELLTDVTSELLELTHLVTELVDLATIGRHDEPLMEVDVGEVIEQAAERVRRRANARIVTSVEPTTVEGRATGLLRAVSNLLENAAKWGPDGGPIEIALTDGKIEVRDRGPGIPEADLPRVFERFYRSPAARAMPGSGLGLSIVAAVAQDHGGQVFALNHPEGGAIVGFTLPTSEE